MANPIPWNPPLRERDGGVDADDFAVNVDQRSAAVAGIDRGVNLDEIFIPLAAEDSDLAAVEGADDAMRHRADVAERAAEGEDPVAFRKRAAVSPLGGDEMVGLKFDDGQIGLGIGADKLGIFDSPSVGKRDDHFAGAAGDVIVRQDVAGLPVHFHDDAAAGADLFLVVAGLFLILVVVGFAVFVLVFVAVTVLVVLRNAVLEESAEQIVVEGQ